MERLVHEDRHSCAKCCETKYDHFPLSSFSFRGGGKLILIIFSLIGFFTFDLVYVTAVMNYAAQSEMLIYLLRSVRGLVEQKGYEGIDAAMKVSKISIS